MQPQPQAARIGTWLRYVYVALSGLALISIAAWILASDKTIRIHWVDVWAPHVATAAAELLVGAAVVDAFVRRLERAEVEPLVLGARQVLAEISSSLLTMLCLQRALLAPLPTNDPRLATVNLGAWRRALESATDSWLSRWLEENQRATDVLNRVQMRYERILEPTLGAAIDRFVHDWTVGAGERVRNSYAHRVAAAEIFHLDAVDGVLSETEQRDVLHSVELLLTVVANYEASSGQTVGLAPEVDDRLRVIEVARLTRRVSEKADPT